MQIIKKKFIIRKVYSFAVCNITKPQRMHERWLIISSYLLKSFYSRYIVFHFLPNSPNLYIFRSICSTGIKYALFLLQCHYYLKFMSKSSYYYPIQDNKLTSKIYWAQQKRQKQRNRILQLCCIETEKAIFVGNLFPLNTTKEETRPRCIILLWKWLHVGCSPKFLHLSNRTSPLLLIQCQAQCALLSQIHFLYY